MFPFSSTRAVGSGGTGDLNIFLFERATGQVFTWPGLNTPANEFFPSLSHGGRYLTYTTDAPGHGAIYRYDVKAQLVDTLPRLNTDTGDALRGVSSDDGNVIAYSEVAGDRTRMWLYDLRTSTRLAPIQPPLTNPIVRDISPDGRTVAFSASVGGQLDIAFYAIDTAAIVTPPFLNSPFNETGPVFSPDGKRLVYVTDQAGSSDVWMADLTTGLIDRLPLLNSPAVEADPVFLPDGDEILFQSNRTGRPGLYIYELSTHRLDTVPQAEIDVARPPG